MKMREVSQLGAVTIEHVGRFLIFMARDDWAPDEFRLDVERLTRAMERAMAAVDDEWTIPEFADLTAAEYARLAREPGAAIADDPPDASRPLFPASVSPAANIVAGPCPDCRDSVSGVCTMHNHA